MFWQVSEIVHIRARGGAHGRQGQRRHTLTTKRIIASLHFRLLRRTTSDLRRRSPWRSKWTRQLMGTRLKVSQVICPRCSTPDQSQKRPSVTMVNMNRTQMGYMWKYRSASLLDFMRCVHFDDFYNVHSSKCCHAQYCVLFSMPPAAWAFSKMLQPLCHPMWTLYRMSTHFSYVLF